MTFLKDSTKAILKSAGWLEHIQPFLDSQGCRDLHKFLADRIKSGAIICPKESDWFRPLRMTPFDDVKVVILSQDPYNAPNQANGLAFAVSKGRPATPSLNIILKEVGFDLGVPAPRGTSLECWAKQGVLLLNSVLTTERGAPGSHLNKGWESLTDLVVQSLVNKRTGIVFMLWGNQAEKKVGHVSYKHLKLVAGHPSPISANMFVGNKHFSQANKWLIGHGLDPIKWECTEEAKKSSFLDLISGDDSHMTIKEVAYDDQY